MMFDFSICRRENAIRQSLSCRITPGRIPGPNGSAGSIDAGGWDPAERLTLQRGELSAFDGIDQNIGEARLLPDGRLLVGTVNARVKSKRNYWNRPVGAEAILQLRAAELSQDDRFPPFFAERPGCPFRKRGPLSHKSENTLAQTAA